MIQVRLLTAAVPDSIIPKEIKDRAFNRAIDFLNETYALQGWSWKV